MQQKASGSFSRSNISVGSNTSFNILKTKIMFPFKEHRVPKDIQEQNDEAVYSGWS